VVWDERADLKSPQQQLFLRMLNDRYRILFLFITVVFHALFIHKVSAQSCGNMNFEASAPGTYTAATTVSGWTVSSQTITSCNNSTVWTPGSPEFSIVSTPIANGLPSGWLYNSPITGSLVARIHDVSPGALRTKLSKSFSVSLSATLFEFAYAGSWQDGGHSCCEQPSFKVQVLDPSGNVVMCPSYSLAGVGCQYVPTYSTMTGLVWTGWQTAYIDLSPYVGNTITIEVINSDCAYGDHYGSVYFDANCPTQLQGPCMCSIPTV
jgi:hypothetical protein